MMNTMELFFGLIWGVVLWRVFVYLQRDDGKARTVGELGAEAKLRREPTERDRKALIGSLGWLRGYALQPERAVNMVALNGDVVVIAKAHQDVRDAVNRCFEEGRCRGVEFTQFMTGGRLADDHRLVFVSIVESDLQARWYGLVAPRRYVDAVASIGR